MTNSSAVNNPAVYTVSVENTPHRFPVRADETVLQAALQQGIELPWGCGGGICGTCMSDLVSGEVVYDAPPLALFEEDEARGKGLICVAYPRSDLILHIPEIA